MFILSEMVEWKTSKFPNCTILKLKGDFGFWRSFQRHVLVWYAYAAHCCRCVRMREGHSPGGRGLMVLGEGAVSLEAQSSCYIPNRINDFLERICWISGAPHGQAPDRRKDDQNGEASAGGRAHL